ncbi:hypothetical protein HIM_01095 [Hirsutella minnesotensis 3608]|nr:hypothetical protein HIM_01095 [Hirsutella minnesotensis 3608]
MATKTKSYALNGSHTAGIFADMSVDGPPIGTLVTVVDRAKNLPNRKTIGKQDPYCAARLGKEARKTNTDHRGGQTPKWDQELRFNVHDSPDYYQLKISVFTDDKKTDLIGDAWIDLKGIIVPGGGQNDMWQTLSCKGKYAGEIRLEITYYDSRPKPEKLAVKRRQPAPSELDGGSMRQKTPVKRRPLPSDPITGEAPSPPAVTPQPAGHASVELHQQTPPRPQSLIPSQSPLQAIEYNTPPVSRHLVDQYSPSPQSGYSTARVDGPRAPRETYETPSRHPEERAIGPRTPTSPYEPAPPRGRRSPLPDSEMLHVDDPRHSQPPEAERPPPPPAHRSMPSLESQDLVRRSVYDSPPQAATPSTPMRHEVLKSEAHRHSAPAYPGKPVFRPYDPNMSNKDDSPLPPRYHSYDPSGEPHHRSMQPTVEDVPESPPTLVDRDRPHGQTASRSVSRDEMMFEMTSREDTMNIMRSPGAAAHRASQSTGHVQDSWQEQGGHSREPSNSLVHRPHQAQNYRSSNWAEIEPSHSRNASHYTLPDIPPTLAPGMDPNLSREILEQIHIDRRNEGRYAAVQATTPTRGRHQSEASSPYRGSSPGYVTYSSGHSNQLVRQHRKSPSPSPNATHTIPRKSVSPSPPSAEDRSTSGMPFGPDSYDALNPVMGSPRDTRPRNDRAEGGGKIITHDGREVDPSDHLPMESWAPEPEPKAGQVSPLADSRTRSTPSGAQPMPPSGRRALRMARSQPNTLSSPTYHGGDDAQSPMTPISAGRQRLQRKTPRETSTSIVALSSPLAPMSTDNYQDRQISYAQSSGPRRWGSWDYPSENHAPYHGTAPPIPDKVPLVEMSGGSGPGDMALVHELRRIDIGSGPSRRKGGY